MEDKKTAILSKISSNKPIQSDNPLVEMTKLKLDAISRLSENTNEAFSSHEKSKLVDETVSFSLANIFAQKPLPQLESRLNARGIVRRSGRLFEGEPVGDEPVQISIPILSEYISEVLKRRHSTNRSRVSEYIQSLGKLGNVDVTEMQQRPSMLSRLG